MRLVLSLSIFLVGSLAQAADRPCSRDLLIERYLSHLNHSSVSGLEDRPSPQGKGHFLYQHLRQSSTRLVSFQEKGVSFIEVETKLLVARFSLAQILPPSACSFYPAPDCLQIRFRRNVDFADIPDTLLGIELPKRESQTGGMVVAGVNSDAALRRIKTINDAPIREIELNMRPGEAIPASYAQLSQPGGVYAIVCDSGFLSRGQKLLDTLIEQNRFVRRNFRISHQELILPVYRIVGAVRNGFIPHGTVIRYRGARLEVTVRSAGQPLNSPFMDGTRSRTYVGIRNLENQEEISFSTLLPEMIYRYGFYESPSIRDHLDPQKLAQVLPFLLPE